MRWGVWLMGRLLTPVYDTASRYTLRQGRSDAQAGLTVALVDLPQAMAYALIAGVPVEYGVYTSIIQGFIAALFSSSQNLASGPTNTQSLLIASVVTRLAGSDAALYLQLVFALAMLKGVIQLLFAVARMGHMVRFVSRSVILGLMAGAGVLIAVGQLPHLLGLPAEAMMATTGKNALPGVVGQVMTWGPALPKVDWRTLTIGLMALAIMGGCRVWSRRIPGAILAIVVTTFISVLAGWDGQAVAHIGPVQGKLPGFHWPEVSWLHVERISGGALALAVLGMLESVAITKSLAGRRGQRVDANQEFVAQGLSNLVGGMFQCIPGSGSFTRSALNQSSGGQTRFAAVFCSLFVAVIFLLLSDMVRHIPLASLAAVLLVIAADLVQWKPIFRTIASNHEDASVCLATFVATLLAPLEYAIFIGVFLNIGLFVRRTSRLQMNQIVSGGLEQQNFIEQPVRDSSGQEPVLFLQMEGNLFFGVADELEDRLTRIVESPAKVVVFRLKQTAAIDSTVLHVFEQFIRAMQSRGGHVLLCGVKPELMEQLAAYGLCDLLGPAGVYEASNNVFTSARRALMHARHLLGEDVAVDDVAEAREMDDGSSYSI